MRLLAAAMAFTVVLLAGAAVAPAADVGANDDSAKHAADHGAAMYGEMAAVGLRQTVIGVRFKPSEAVVIQDKRLLDRIIPNALDARLRVVLACIRTRRGRSRRVSGARRSSRRTYPRSPRSIPRSGSS